MSNPKKLHITGKISQIKLKFHMMGSLKRGALIVIEGADRSGKSTQCKNLVTALNNKNIKAQLINFPDRTTKTGKLIGEYLSNPDCKLHDNAIHLLFSANRWENFDKMKKLLYDGVTLIVDRYSYSGIAYSAIKKGMDINWCRQPENGLLRPDLVLLFTITAEELAKRPGFGNERYENIEMQQKVSDMFLKMSQEDANWDLVNVEGTVEDVLEKILIKALKIADNVATSPLQYLNFSTHQKNGL